MEQGIKILSEEDEGNYFPVECEVCGWIGSSGHAGGGHQIADTGDYADIFCPCCGSLGIEETDNEQPYSSYPARLDKATDLVKRLTEKIEGYDLSKYNYAFLEEENKRMAKELTERDLFAITFGAWIFGTEGEMYRATNMSAYDLMQKYKDRPYINTDPSKQ